MITLWLVTVNDGNIEIDAWHNRKERIGYTPLPGTIPASRKTETTLSLMAEMKIRENCKISTTLM